MLVQNNNPPGYKGYLNYFLSFSFGEGVTIIEWPVNMKFYVSDVVESYKETIIVHLGNIGTTDLVLHIVQCWRAYAGDKENWDISIVL